MNKIWHSNFMIRLRSWEYWPLYVVYFPPFFYWLWLSLRLRSFFFFSASNPTIESGGMLGESKSRILKLVPEHVKPKTLLFKKGADTETVISEIKHSYLNYPIIAKPDVGERGWQVEKINNQTTLEKYIKTSPVDFIIQEYINLPIELGVFYYRMPDQEQGQVSSIVEKEMLKVEGDGQSTIKELMLKYDRAKLQITALENKRNLTIIPEKGEKIELVSIGNHCKGTTFLNANHLITESLRKQFDQLSKQIDGFFFGRYDLRCASYEALYNGEVKIMELNGAGAEPAHIYHPGFSILEAYRVLFKHWKILAQISKINHQRGIKYMTISEAKDIWIRLKTKQAAT